MFLLLIFVIYIFKNIIMETKKCCRCNQQKPLEMFVANNKSADGRKGYCKQCHASRVQQWRDNNLSLNRAVQRAHYYKRKANALQEN